MGLGVYRNVNECYGIHFINKFAVWTQHNQFFPSNTFTSKLMYYSVHSCLYSHGKRSKWIIQWTCTWINLFRLSRNQPTPMVRNIHTRVHFNDMHVCWLLLLAVAWMNLEFWMDNDSCCRFKAPNETWIQMTEWLTWREKTFNLLSCWHYHWHKTKNLFYVFILSLNGSEIRS